MTDPKPPRQQPRPRRGTEGADRGRIAIVGIGASAVAIDSLDTFFGAAAEPPSWATVLILTHREALDEARLGETLRARGGLVLETIESGASPEAGRVYLAPQGALVTVKGGRFRVRKAEEAPGHRGSVDSFLLSLADSEGERAIGIVLAGTNGDGTLGIARLKETGGLSIAEGDPTSPSEAIAAASPPGALADFVLPAGEILDCIRVHVQRVVDSGSARDLSAEISAALGQVAAILRSATGHDFHGYKPGTFTRRVERRMHVLRADSADEYLERLRADGAEVQSLFNDLLIGVTQFFRDKREFELLESDVIPRMFAGKGAADQLRVWVLGCATGEEAYSVAILLREHAAKLQRVPQIQIFATDIDVRALAAARVGRYSSRIAADMSPERLGRWFVKEGDTYCVLKELREMCIFSSHSVVKDPPFSRLDLVSCRNLLIYLTPELQTRVIPLFHFALRPDGYLFLGNSEGVARHSKMFEPIERRSRIFHKLEMANRTIPDFPSATSARYRVADKAPPAQTRPMLGVLARRAERIVERFSPAYVITNEDLEVVHFSGQMGRYLGPSSGAASLDLFHLVNRDLRVELRAAITRAIDANQSVEVADIPMQLDGHDALVQLYVEPIPGTPGRNAQSFVVVFRDGIVRPHSESPSDMQPGDRDRHIARLEAELRLKSERLQTTVEELESTNEELTSSNEEFQSLNEELQSANEELETSKEELQSINEELNTVNGELGHRVHDLTRTTSDLNNFFQSTQIATIFLDNDLCVMNFTPAATELFRLVETDIGRPLSHIKAAIRTDDLVDGVRTVLRTLSVSEYNVESETLGTRYMVRVLPYRSIGNFISGAVVTFTNVTPLTRAETALRTSESRFRAIFESAAEYAIIAMDSERRTTGWSTGARNLTGWTEAEMIGRSADIIFTAEDQTAGAPLSETGAADAAGRAANERWHVRKDGSRFWGSGVLTPMRDEGVVGYVKIFSDRTEPRAAEDRQRVLLAELQHRVRNTLGIVRSIARRTANTSDTVEEYSMHLDGRINAFARVQAAVTRDPTAGVDLGMVVAEELIAYGAHESEQVRIEGPALRLQPKAAETLGLAIHELATNAIKYGALTSKTAKLAVLWSIGERAGSRVLTLEWRESGIALDPAAPRRRGFGMELLDRTLTYELEAETALDFSPDGLRCTIMFPLTDRTEVRPQASARVPRPS